jgi:1-acyl-sn-glycerol-3-phosphate acyltransferase
MTVSPYSKVTEADYGWYRTLFQRIVVIGLTLFLHVKYRYRVEGKEHIPEGIGSYIVVANHTSNLDPPIVSVALFPRTIAYMAKAELFTTPFKRWLYRNLGTFSVNRAKLEMSTIKSAKAVLNTGTWHLGMFPEGTRNKDITKVAEAKKGVAFLAKTCNKPILPMGIIRSGPDRKDILARIGPLIPCEGSVEELTETVRLKLAELTGLPVDDLEVDSDFQESEASESTQS